MDVAISLAQIDVELGRPEKNLHEVTRCIKAASHAGSDIVLFPELWSTGYDLENWKQHASPLNSGMFMKLSSLANEYKISVVGSLLENDNGKAYNTMTVTNANGDLLGYYRKIHLFGLMDEPNWLFPGKIPVIMSAPWGVTGLAICYDLRFPELFRFYGMNGVQIVFIVAEWPLKRVSHWQTLLRARAIENQMYLVAVNRVGESKGEVFGGHSMVIDPWGEIIVEGGTKAEHLTARLDLSRVEEARRRIPVFDDRRPETYNGE